MLKVPLAAILLCLSAAVHAQPGDRFARWLTGHWQGSGEVSGETSMARLDVESVLGGEFLELSYGFVAGSSSRFEGRGFYRQRGETAWQGQWFDSSGSSYRLSGAVGEDELVVHWGDFGRSIYRRTGEDQMLVLDSMRVGDGTWREFGRQDFVRLSVSRE